MADLERDLHALAAAIDWPPTPPLHPRFEPRARRAWLRPAAIAVAAVLLAIAVALSVPAARSAILRVFHLGGVTVERVKVLPPAQQRPPASDLGVPVTARTAQELLGMPMRLPMLDRPPQLYRTGDAISTLFERPRPVLLTEIRSGDAAIFKKILSARTAAVYLQVGTVPGLWISGQPHVFEPVAVPPRLAGNVLIWVSNGVTFRLEGRHLTKQDALSLAREIQRGT